MSTAYPIVENHELVLFLVEASSKFSLSLVEKYPDVMGETLLSVTAACYALAKLEEKL